MDLQPADRPFIVVSGLPGSGKTTLAYRLAPAVRLPVIDKDEILERLFDGRGIGDPTWRRKLSRESDAILREEAAASDGAILVSFWHLRGMPTGSGTPTDWLESLSSCVVNVHCVCSLDVSAHRFMNRKRHAGHLDGARSLNDIRTSLAALPQDGPSNCGERIDVNTTIEPDLLDLTLRLRASLGRPGA